MQQFTVAKTPVRPGEPPGWNVKINGCLRRQYTSKWAAIVDAFVAAHDATHDGEEATVVMETSVNQVWSFSLMPCLARRDGEHVTGSVANDADGPSGRSAALP